MTLATEPRAIVDGRDATPAARAEGEAARRERALALTRDGDRPHLLDLSRRNVLLLALCQAAFMSSAALMATVGTLVGHALAADKALATLPATAVVVGTAVGTIPASLLTRRAGRQIGFIAGTGFAIAGGLVGAAAIGLGSFWLLALGCGLVGMSSAFGQLYRFAAAEAVSPEKRSRAISLVLAGGLVASFVGPQLARVTADLFATPFVGSVLTVPLLALVTVLFLAGLRLPAAVSGQAAGSTRPLSAIARQPTFLAAVVSQMTGYGVMNLLMTGTPLAMTTYHGHGLRDAVFVIQWHMVGMFLPSFFTGALIQRIGERATILLGIAVNVASVAVAFTGFGVWQFWLALTLLGVGWNLMFVGGSTLVTRTYTSAERAKAQAANDFVIWTTVAVTSLSSGQLLHRHGWHAVVTTAAPLLALAVAAMLAGAWRARSETAAGGGQRLG
jgi:predicted MFS family arabinose efflux permease